MRFRTKLLLCLVLVLNLSMSISGALIIRGSFQNALDAQWNSGINAYQMTAYALEMTDRNDADSLGKLLDQMQEIAGWSCVRLRQNREVIYQFGREYTELSPPLSAKECAARLFGDHYIQYSGMITVQEQILELTLVKDVSIVYTDREQQLAVYHSVFLLTAAMGVPICWNLAYLLTRPLSKISRAARKISAGDLSVQLEEKERDEIGQLSRDFNHMTRRLQENIYAMEEAMAAQERFVGSFAHELKTPMTAVIGYADLLRTQALTGEQAQEAANYIFSEAKRLESLSLKLLELLVAKNEQLQQKEISIRDLVYTLAERLKPIYKAEGIQLSCYCQSGNCRADPELLRSVLVNLLDNARKAMDHGGRIHVEAEFENGFCRILIADNGRGIPDEMLEHLTEAFYRVDKSRSRAQGGAGLGLALCHEIIARHGGRLDFCSRPGEGTGVTVVLPCGEGIK